MRIAIVHGYFLGDSGSAIYTRELARELVRQGHEVTLICQEQRPEDYEFIDRAYDLDDANCRISLVFEREDRQKKEGFGRCRLVRPNLGGPLLTYGPGPFSGFESIPFQEASTPQIDQYIKNNVRAVKTIFARWPPQLAQANHAIMQPFVVGQSLRGAAPYVVTTHGSEMNFSIRKDWRLHPFALQGLAGAAAVVALSEAGRREIQEFASGYGLDIAGKASVLLPGVNTGCFHPRVERAGAVKNVPAPLDPGNDFLAFAGRQLWTKGLHYAVCSLPLILQKRPNLHLLVAGEGGMHLSLERLIDALNDGNWPAAERLLAGDPELRAQPEFGPVLPKLNRKEKGLYLKAAHHNLRQRVHFLGHLPHSRLSQIFAAADLCLAPSVFPEAFALVGVEALASGALPLVADHSGFHYLLAIVEEGLGDGALRQLKPGVPLTITLAATTVRLLEAYPTKNIQFRERLYQIAKKNFSWANVAERYLQFGISGPCC